MSEECTLADSTIALTVYNWLAVTGGMGTVQEIADGIAPWVVASKILLTPQQLQRAVGELVRRGYLGHRDGLYGVKDPVRRVVVTRNRDGDGWDGWQVYARPVQHAQRVQLGNW
jgi:hypothetical protein